MSFPPTPRARKTSNLHIGRFSYSSVPYFVTFVTADRSPWLGNPAYRASVLETLRNWHSRGDGEVIAVSVMPDHVHVLFRAGETLTIGQTVASWKTAVRRRIQYAESFQRDFWEHRLRDGEAIEDYALYVFLNAYRSGLAKPDSQWEGWWAPQPELFQFSAFLVNGTPPSEWLDWPAERFADLKVGE